MKTLKRLPLLSALGLVIVGGSGCMSVQNQSVTEEIKKGESPYVEAVIEYQGPASKWFGPSSVVLYVNARDMQNPSVTVTPEFQIFEIEKKYAPRSLAQADGNPAKAAKLREMVAKLALSLKELPDPVVVGCLSPVKVRLLREDGGLTERQGCRTREGFGLEVSRNFSEFASMAL